LTHRDNPHIISKCEITLFSINGYKGGIEMKKVFIALMVLTGILSFSVLYAADLHGVVTGKDGKPAVVKVVLKDAKDAQVGDPATSDKDGAYAFKDIKPGNYTVSIGEKNDKNEWKIFVGPGETRRDFLLK
jgi:hypothetical protein